MKRFCKIGVLGLLCALAFTARADEKKPATKIPLVTRDNFVSLEFANRDEIGNSQTQFVITGNELRIEEVKSAPSIGAFTDKDSPEISDSLQTNTYDSQPMYGLDTPIHLASSSTSPRSKSVGLSNNQLELLENELNKVQFKKAAIEDNVERLMQARNAIKLVISDETSHDQIYIAQDPEDDFAPKYWTLENYLYSFQKQKFPDGTLLWSNQYVPFTSWYFKSLTLETSGGMAGIHSTIKVQMSPDGDHLQWSQSVNGKESGYDEGLGARGTWVFFRSLNAVNLPGLNGKSYKQRNLADGFNEMLTLTLNDERKFTFSNYGDQAPREYLTFVNYLRGLQPKKTPDN